jgi:dethiobiotin synthetase
MTRGYFITGTDTGVGKTLVACALLHAFAARGYSTVGMKPIASGAERMRAALRSDDVERLIAAASVAAPRHLVNPYCFEPPIAPHIAAQRAGTSIELDLIARCHDELAAAADMVVVEGVGGFLVPLGPRIDVATLAVRLGLPVVLVVGMRLGCLNHALLTAEAIAARGLALAGWIANHVDPEMAAADENVRALEERLAAPLVARIAWAESVDTRSIAAQFDPQSDLFRSRGPQRATRGE